MLAPHFSIPCEVWAASWHHMGTVCMAQHCHLRDLFASTEATMQDLMAGSMQHASPGR